MTKKVLLVILLMLACGPATVAAASPQRHELKHHPKRKKVLHKAGWAGAGIAAGRLAGPAGSAAVGAAKYRRDLKAGGHKDRKSVV